MFFKLAIFQSAKNFLKATGLVAVTNGVSSAVITALGFAKGGVVAGSVAAGVQSGIGAVSAGSIFAGLQSLGALGLGVLGTCAVPVTVGAGVVAGGLTFFNKWWKK